MVVSRTNHNSLVTRDARKTTTNHKNHVDQKRARCPPTASNRVSQAMDDGNPPKEVIVIIIV